MHRASWVVELEDGPHVVELAEGHPSMGPGVRLDGEPVDATRGVWDFGLTYRFEAAGHDLVICVRYRWLLPTFDLLVDGHRVGAGAPDARAVALGLLLL